MKAARNSFDEEQRIQALRLYEVLDTPRDEAFQELVELATHVAATPIGFVSLVDEDRQWFKAACGFDASETSRDIAFCAHAILDSQPLVVPDATKDERFAENPLVTRDGIRFYAGVPIQSHDGYALGTLCVLDRVPRDLPAAAVRALVTIARQVEARLELGRIVRELGRNIESRQRLAAFLVHDLRNPLGAVRMNANMLVEGGSLTALQTEIVQDIDAATKRVLGMTEDLLHQARSEAGALQPRWERFSPGDLLAQVLAESGARAAARQVTLRVRLDQRTTIDGDPQLLRRVFFNLVDNAIKYGSEKTSSHVDVSLSPVSQDCIELSIADEGPGLEPEALEKIFEPFVRLDATAHRIGFGLGLSVCRTIADAHQGRIWAEKNIPRGCVFRLQLPTSRVKV